jgi:hypothetical protein
MPAPRDKRRERHRRRRLRLETGHTDDDHNLAKTRQPDQRRRQGRTGLPQRGCASEHLARFCWRPWSDIREGARDSHRKGGVPRAATDVSHDEAGGLRVEDEQEVGHASSFRLLLVRRFHLAIGLDVPKHPVIIANKSF